MHILVVEDNTRVHDVVVAALREGGHALQGVTTCEQAERALREGLFDLAIVDIGLPDGSGLDVCRRARADGLDVPILFLTARTEVTDRVDGLDAGGDDYLCKPFASAELLARVRALGRRGPHWTESVRMYGHMTIDRDRRLVTISGERVPLTPRELDIVCALAWRDGRVVNRPDLLEAVWGDDAERGAASLEVLVARIRRKFSLMQVSDAIRTVRQAGYAWALQQSKQG